MKPSYISFDKVKIFEGDNFYFLVSVIINGEINYCIKYWDCKVMESFAKNKTYLMGKLKFAEKCNLKKYIDENNLRVINYNYIFAPLIN